MCDMEKITKQKNELIYDIDKILMISNANIIKIKKELIEIEKRSHENLRQLSLLL